MEIEGEMHRETCDRARVQVEQVQGLQHMRVASGQHYRSPGEAYVEGDASSASYFLAGQPEGAWPTQCTFSYPAHSTVVTAKARAGTSEWVLAG